MKIWQLFYTLWQGGQENKRRKFFSFLKAYLYKSRMLSKKIWVLVFSFKYLVSVDPMDRSNNTSNFVSFDCKIVEICFSSTVTRKYTLRSNRQKGGLKRKYHSGPRKMEGPWAYSRYMGSSAKAEWPTILPL